CRLVPEPIPAVPRSMPGLSSRASAGSVGGSSGRLALARVGRAGSFLLCLAGSRGGVGDFAIAANMGGVAWRGKAGVGLMPYRRGVRFLDERLRERKLQHHLAVLIGHHQRRSEQAGVL